MESGAFEQFNFDGFDDVLGGAKFSFGIQSSANINTNPRTENTAVIIDHGLYEFYRKYYDGIISFEQ